MIDALISGQAGIAILIGPTGFSVLHIDHPGVDAPITPARVPHFLCGATDVSRINSISREELCERLRVARDCDTALQLTLILLDRGAELETREAAAGSLQLLFTAGEVQDFVLNRLYSAPLPDDSNVLDACAHVGSAGLVLSFLLSLEDNQPQIEAVRNAWDRLPADLFVSSIPKASFQQILVDAGAFRTLAEAGADPARFNHAREHCYAAAYSLRNSRLVIDDWLRLIQPDVPASPHPLSIPRDTHGKGGQGRGAIWAGSGRGSDSMRDAYGKGWTIPKTREGLGPPEAHLASQFDSEMLTPVTTGTLALDDVPVGRLAEFAAEVRDGLTKNPKVLPSKYLYDSVGSALFEAITLLPEYGLTRAEQRILSRHADEIAAAEPPPVIVVELGSGSVKKTRFLLEALARRQPTTYHPIEISRTDLAGAEHVLGHLEGVSVRGFEAEYLDGLGHAAARRSPNERLLVLFLGSSIGNFDRDEACEFLVGIRKRLEAGDALLLGADLLKPVAQMILAYNDPAGVAAAFNLNLLARINRELGADFNLRQFDYQAIYSSGQHRIEMHLRSTTDQTVTISQAGFRVGFRRGETIWTQSAHKYASATIARMAACSGFRVEAEWVDSEGLFADSLLVAV